MGESRRGELGRKGGIEKKKKEERWEKNGIAERRSRDGEETEKKDLQTNQKMRHEKNRRREGKKIRVGIEREKKKQRVREGRGQGEENRTGEGGGGEGGGVMVVQRVSCSKQSRRPELPTK